MARRSSIRPSLRHAGDSGFETWSTAPEGYDRLRRQVAPSPNPIPNKGSSIKADELRVAFQLAEHYARYNEWVQLSVRMLRAFGMYGARIVEDGDTGRNRSNALRKWLKDHGDTIAQLHRGIWNEMLVNDNAIVATLPGVGPTPRPMILPPSNVDFSNRLGMEVLKFQHGLNASEIQALPSELRSCCTPRDLDITKVRGAKWRVLTEARYGEGLDAPSMMSVFHGCETAEALAAADAALAEAARRVVILHKLGYEIRTGPMAGMATHHAKAPRIKEVKKQFASKSGCLEAADNFDHEIQVYAVDPKYFDERRLNTVERRLFLWSAPIGQMLTTRGGIAPFLMTMLRVRMEDLRQRIGATMATILNDHMSAPVDLKVRYDSRILRDDRLALDALKFALTSGLASQRTARGDVGLDDAEERRQKREEFNLHPSETLPVFDPAHGKQPGEAAGRRGGRTKEDGSPADGNVGT